MFTGRKLALTLAFTVLVALAFGVSCRGFFPPNSLTAIAIQPPTVQIEIGPTFAQTLQAWGTYQDNTRSQLMSGVEWTSSDNTVVQIGLTSGVATGVGTGGQATITASAQGLSGTAQATAYLGAITGFQVCKGTFGNTTSCSSGSNPLVWDATNAGTTTPTATFIAQANNPSPPPALLDLTTASTWTVVGSATGIQCTNAGVSPETCTVTEKTPNNTYPVTVTYGTSATATLNIVVTQ